MAGLTATQSSGTQSTTQTPQPSVQSDSGAAKATSVQPGTAANLLTSQTGVPLGGTALTTVSLAPSAQSQTTKLAVTAPQPKHHINAGLFVFPVILLVVAVVLFWSTARSVKSTT